MILTFILVGKIKETFYSDAIKMYIKRLSKYVTTEFVNIEESKYSSLKSQKDIERGLLEEGKLILSKVSSSDSLILFDTKGTSYDSVAFSKLITESSLTKSHLIFVIGGSNGLSDEVRARANKRIKISDFTFTHPLAMVIATEQVYRAFKIANNEAYHK